MVIFSACRASLQHLCPHYGAGSDIGFNAEENDAMIIRARYKEDRYVCPEFYGALDVSSEVKYLGLGRQQYLSTMS